MARTLFPLILESRNYSNSPHFSLRYTASPEGLVKIGVTVSKKVSKSAVVRNTVRRRAYSALAPFLSILPTKLYLVIAKPGAEAVRGEILRAELKKLFETVK